MTMVRLFWLPCTFYTKRSCKSGYTNWCFKSCLFNPLFLTRWEVSACLIPAVNTSNVCHIVDYLPYASQSIYTWQIVYTLVYMPLLAVYSVRRVIITSALTRCYISPGSHTLSVQYSYSHSIRRFRTVHCLKSGLNLFNIFNTCWKLHGLFGVPVQFELY